jgi:hypothetical protein
MESGTLVPAFRLALEKEKGSCAPDNRKNINDCLMFVQKIAKTVVLKHIVGLLSLGN